MAYLLGKNKEKRNSLTTRQFLVSEILSFGRVSISLYLSLLSKVRFQFQVLHFEFFGRSNSALLVDNRSHTH